MTHKEHSDFADPIKGVSRIDGLDIRTDSMKDLRWDRVMPILIEEQVFMCHQMWPTVCELRQRLGRPLNILDLGCGSGVFGIFLDHKLNRNEQGEPLPESDRSKVVCLDINPRAIRFVIDNAKRNGSINVQTRCERYGLNSAPKVSQDIIIINPPYHPVFGHWVEDVSLHGSAGEDGLAVFRNWKDAIAAHLTPAGKLIGSIMSPVLADGTIVAMHELSEAFGPDESEIHFCRHLNEPDPEAGHFLRGVYAEYLPAEPELEVWIRAMEKRFSCFTVIYFEATKHSRGKPGIHQISSPHPEEFGKMTWRDRIHIHALMARKTTRYPAEDRILGAHSPGGAEAR